jgi:hypothetical protein
VLADVLQTIGFTLPVLAAVTVGTQLDQHRLTTDTATQSAPLIRTALRVTLLTPS